ncbi:caspase-3-like [Haliotis asinina]|uniref:caspase-3-like n=1 Tax=Haliotis asinina TaxID=109174 RepID=UPI003531EE36
MAGSYDETDSSFMSKTKINCTGKSKPNACKLPYDPSMSSEDELKKYDITRNGRKLAVIINISEFESYPRMPQRTHAKTDEAVITNMLEQLLGFEVFPKENLTLQDLTDLFKEMRTWDYKNVETMAVVVMSYGNNREIYTHDGQKVEMKVLLDNLKGKKCKGLAGKPKIVFINAGSWEESPEDLDGDYDEVDACVTRNEETDPREKTICIPKECDFIHVYSPVTFGHQKAGNVEQGNIFLTALSEMCLKLDNKPLEFCDMLTRTNRQVAHRVRSASNIPARPCFFLSTLTKELYLMSNT